MADNERFAIATHLYVLLKRRLNRSIDTVWLMENADYSREIARLCRSTGEEELIKLAARLEELPLGARAPDAAAGGALRSPVGKGYVGTLR